MTDHKAAVAEVTEQLTHKIEALVTSEDWKATLRVAARFHNYSFNNVLWLQIQAARREMDLSRVAGFRTWQSLGRNVQKGETSLRVLAPMKYKAKGEDGKPDTWIVRGFTLAPVFDISQTAGEAIIEPPRPQLLTGDGNQEALATIIELIEAAGFTFHLAPRSALGLANGDANFAQKIVRTRDDLSPAATLKTTVHELAHVMLHAPDKVSYHQERGRCEVEAESVAYVVLNHLGIDSDDYTLPYVAGWSGGKVDVIRDAAAAIIKTAHTVIEALTVATEAAVVDAAADSLVSA